MPAGGTARRAVALLAVAGLTLAAGLHVDTSDSTRQYPEDYPEDYAEDYADDYQDDYAYDYPEEMDFADRASTRLPIEDETRPRSWMERAREARRLGPRLGRWNRRSSLATQAHQVRESPRLTQKAFAEMGQAVRNFRTVSARRLGSRLAMAQRYRRHLYPYAVPFPWVMRGRFQNRQFPQKRMGSYPNKAAQQGAPADHSTTPSPVVQPVQPATVALVMQLNPGNVSLHTEACEVLAKQVPYFGGGMAAESEAPATPGRNETGANSSEMRMSSEVRAITSELKARQAKIWNSRAPALALDAMRDHPDDYRLQGSCIKMMSAITAWNRDTEEAAAKAGALELSLQAMNAHSDKAEVVSQMMAMSHFNDLSETNRERMQALGAVKLIGKLGMLSSDQETSLATNRLASTLCTHPHGFQELLQTGYIQSSVQAMSKFRKAPGIRGEVLQALNTCFMGHPKHRAQMLDAGLIPELLQVLRDVPKQPDLDMLGGVRAQYNAMDMMAKLAEGNQPVKDAFLKAGALEVIGQTLAEEEPAGMFMQQDRMQTACRLLYNLLGNLDMPSRELVEKTEVMEVVIPRISERIKDKRLQDTCRPLLSAWYKL